jgi:hypothetical protein
MLLDAFKELLLYNDISLDLYFVTLQPIEFTELDNIETKIKREEETGEKLSAVEDVQEEEIVQQEASESVSEAVVEEKPTEEDE